MQSPRRKPALHCAGLRHWCAAKGQTVGIRVLIAEDEANIVESLSFILGRAGHDVRSVGDGDAALLCLRTEPPPQLLILDVMLPRRNGFEVLKAIRADPRLARCAIYLPTRFVQLFYRHGFAAL